MDFRGKLALLFLLAAVLASCLVVSVQADGVQPCKYIKIRDGQGTEADCMACCEQEGLVKAVSFNQCRCRTKNVDEQ